MSDEKEEEGLKIGEHNISNKHSHAYDTLKEMSEDLREQVFHNARHNENGGLFTVRKGGKDFEYKLLKHGEIHPVNHS